MYVIFKTWLVMLACALALGACISAEEMLDKDTAVYDEDVGQNENSQDPDDAEDDASLLPGASGLENEKPYNYYPIYLPDNREEVVENKTNDPDEDYNVYVGGVTDISVDANQTVVQNEYAELPNIQYSVEEQDKYLIEQAPEPPFGALMFWAVLGGMTKLVSIDFDNFYGALIMPMSPEELIEFELAKGGDSEEFVEVASAIGENKLGGMIIKSGFECEYHDDKNSVGERTECYKIKENKYAYTIAFNDFTFNYPCLNGVDKDFQIRGKIKCQNYIQYWHNDKLYDFDPSKKRKGWIIEANCSTDYYDDNFPGAGFINFYNWNESHLKTIDSDKNHRTYLEFQNLKIKLNGVGVDFDDVYEYNIEGVVKVDGKDILDEESKKRGITTRHMLIKAFEQCPLW